MLIWLPAIVNSLVFGPDKRALYVIIDSDKSTISCSFGTISVVWVQVESDYDGNIILGFNESHNTCEGPASVFEMDWDDFQLICQLL